MSAKVGEAYLEITAKNAKLKSSMKESEKAGESFTKRMQSRLARFGKVAFVGAVAGFAALTAAMGKAAKMAAAEQVQTAQLYHQMKRMSRGAAIYRDEVERLADAQQNYTRFGDTDTRAMLAQLLMLTDDYEGSMKNLRLAQDMAESGMFDMRSSARYLGMAMQGNIEMLGRYIPELKTSVNEQLKFMTSSEKAAFAIELLDKKFGGLAKQIGDTTAGAWAKLKNAISDAWEVMGVEMLDEIALGFDNITDKIKSMDSQLQSVGRVGGKVFKALLHAASVFAEIFEAAEYALDPERFVRREAERENERIVKEFIKRYEEEVLAQKQADESKIKEQERVGKILVDIRKEQTKKYVDEVMRQTEQELAAMKATEQVMSRIAGRKALRELAADRRYEHVLDLPKQKLDDLKMEEFKRPEAVKSSARPRWMGAEDVWKQAMVAGIKDPSLQEQKKQTLELENIADLVKLVADNTSSGFMLE